MNLIYRGIKYQNQSLQLPKSTNVLGAGKYRGAIYFISANISLNHQFLESLKYRGVIYKRTSSYLISEPQKSDLSSKCQQKVMS